LSFHSQPLEYRNHSIYLLEHFRIRKSDDPDIVRLEDFGSGCISSLSFWGVMVCAVKFDGEVQFDAVKIENEPCKHVLAAYFGLAESQVLVSKVLFGSSRVFSEFLGTWGEVWHVLILKILPQRSSSSQSTRNACLDFVQWWFEASQTQRIGQHKDARECHCQTCQDGRE
jgi:hypothetical protein